MWHLEVMGPPGGGTVKQVAPFTEDSEGCAALHAQAGACFGLSAASCRTGFLLARRATWLAAPAGLGASVVLSSAGFMLQTLGFKDGNTVVVCTCAAVSSMLTGVPRPAAALGIGTFPSLRTEALSQVPQNVASHMP